MSRGECILSSCLGQGRRSVYPSHTPSLRIHREHLSCIITQATKNKNMTTSIPSHSADGNANNNTLFIKDKQTKKPICPQSVLYKKEFQL